MQEPHPSDLIERARHGSPDAVTALYDEHHAAIFRYLYYRLNDLGTAEDLTGDVFLRMIQSLPSFQGSPTGLRAWLYQIARNLSIDHLRRLRTHPAESIREDTEALDDPPEQVIESNLESNQLIQALSRLNDEQKDVILLRFVSQLSLAETAQTLHKSEDAVKGLQRRALQTMREAIKQRE